MKYCEFCGKPHENDVPCTCADAVAYRRTGKRAKKQRRKKSSITFLAVTAVVLIIAISCMVSIATKVDPFDYVEVEFKGYNTNGDVELHFDSDVLISELIGDVSDEDEESLSEWFARYEAYYEGIDIKYSPKKNLANGDKVTVTIVASGEAKGKVKSGEKTFTVEGLPDIETVDVFKDVEITFEGLNGEAHPVLRLLSDNEFLRACQFRFDKDSQLFTGDTVTVSILNVDPLAEKYYCIPSESSKTFTVPELSGYLTDAALLPIDDIRDIANKFVIEETKEDKDWFSYSATTHYKTYFATLKDGAYWYEKNKLMIFVTYDEYMDGELRRTIYTPLEFSNILVDSSGSVELVYEDGVNATFTTDMDLTVAKLKETFNLVEVNID